MLRLIFDNGLDVYTSIELQNELKEVLGRKKFSKYLNFPLTKYIAFHNKLSRKIHTTKIIDHIPDPKDNFLFDLAIVAKASCIVTGDKLLLNLKKVHNVKVISLSEFKKTWI